MRELDDREHRHRRILRGDQPSARPRSARAITTSIAGGSVNRGDSANTTISASTPSTHSPAIVSPPKPGLLPGDRGENVIGGVAALDQRRRDDDGDKAADRAAARSRRRCPPRAVLVSSSGCSARLASAPSAAEPAMIQIRFLAAMMSTSTPQTSAPSDEGRRAPQPQRSVIEAIARHAAQRIGVRQRHHRRPQAAGHGVDQEAPAAADAGCRSRKSPSAVAKRGHDDAAAQGLSAVPQAPVTNGSTVNRVTGGTARDHPYPKCIDPDRLQPDREKRQMGADHAEHRAVKQRQPGGELPRRALRSDGDL